MRSTAFATFLMLNDSYLPGSLVLGYAIKTQNIDADLVCLVTGDISKEAKVALSIIYDYVVEVETIYVPYKHRQRRQDLPFVFTRIAALRLGKDGDLGFEYEKIVLLDSDILPISDYADLLKLDTPAGVINEDPTKFKKKDDPSRETITSWAWHETYEPICPHGAKIPSYITDRVSNDPANMGVNSSLLVLTPSYKEYKAILEDIKRPEVQELVGDKFKWPEMQYLSMRWSGKWHNIDVRYNGLNGYPNLKVLKGTHFAGVKPWDFKNDRKAVLNFAKFPDYQLWYKVYMDMVKGYPKLLELRRLKGVKEGIKLTSGA